MSAAIVLPPNPTWAQQRVAAIIQAKTQEDFDAAFDAFIGSEELINMGPGPGLQSGLVVNGAPVTRDGYKRLLQGERFLEKSASVDVKAVTDGPAGGDTPNPATPVGVVGLFFTATYFEGIRIRDAEVQHSVVSSLNITITEDPAIPTFPGGIRDPRDRRRVAALNQVYIDQKGPAALDATITPDAGQ